MVDENITLSDIPQINLIMVKFKQGMTKFKSKVYICYMKFEDFE